MLATIDHAEVIWLGGADQSTYVTVPPRQVDPLVRHSRGGGGFTPAAPAGGRGALEIDVPRPLPIELRSRVVETYLERDSTIDEVAACFRVGSATLKRWVAALRAVGHAQPRPMGSKRHECLISPEGEKFLAELLFVVPDSTLPELVNHDEAAYGVPVSDDAMGRALHQVGLKK